MLDIAHPKRGDTLQLPLMADFATDPIEHKKAGTPAAQPSLFDPTSDEEEWSPLLEAARKLAWKDEDDGK